MASSSTTFNAVSTRKNETDYPLFVDICKLSELDLKIYLNEILCSFYPNAVQNADGYLYAKGNMPVLLTAHMDTVHKELVKDFFEHKTDTGKTIISSPQGIGGDDRCGVYMILRILCSTDFRPSILFCEQEEVGGIGSSKFCKSEYIDDLKSMKFLIELDRAHAYDAVYYDDGNTEFHEWLEDQTGYQEAWGSFSDISNLSPACRVSSVNLSCGYYNAHTTNEFVVIEEMFDTTETVKYLLDKVTKDGEELKQFKYKENIYSFSRYYNQKWDYGNLYNTGYWRDYYYPQTTAAPAAPEKTGYLEVTYYDASNSQYLTWAKEVTNEDSGWVEFFFNHTDVCMDMISDYDYYEI